MVYIEDVHEFLFDQIHLRNHPKKKSQSINSFNKKTIISYQFIIDSFIIIFLERKTLEKNNIFYVLLYNRRAILQQDEHCSFSLH